MSCLGGSLEIREKTGNSIGDEIEVELAEDLEGRDVEIPPQLVATLAQVPSGLALFRKLSYTHQREHVESILAAKREQTREARLARVVELVTRTQQKVR